MYLKTMHDNQDFKQEINKVYIKDMEMKRYLKNYKMNKNKIIYLLKEKRWFKKQIIGYTILVNLENNIYSKEQLEIIYRLKINNQKILIEDFYIDRNYRRKKYGTFLANYIKENYNNIALKPDGDGIYFWKTIDI